MLDFISKDELEHLQTIARHDNLSRYKQDELYTRLDKLCPQRLDKTARPSQPPDDCLPIVVEIASYFYRLTISIAKKYYSRRGSLTFFDLTQEGYFGLIRGVFLFDNSTGYTVATYTTHWIRQAIDRAIKDQGRTIRMPVHMGYELSRIAQVSAEYQRKNGEFASVDHIAERTNKRPDKVKELLEIERITNTDSLDREYIANGKTVTLLDRYHCNGDVDYDQRIEETDLGNTIDDILSHLTPREERVLRMRFGLPPYIEAMKLQDIGKKFGFTRERARQIESEALEKLRELGCIKILVEFL